VLYYAAWKQHYSLYPASERVVAEFKNELVPFGVGKLALGGHSYGTYGRRISNGGPECPRSAGGPFPLKT